MKTIAAALGVFILAYPAFMGVSPIPVAQANAGLIPSMATRGIDDVITFEVDGESASSSLYLPMVLKSLGQPQPAGGIGGQVNYNRAPASGNELDLRYHNGSYWSTTMTTTTGSDGRYFFNGAPNLGAGEKYQVRFGPNNTDDRYLFNWYCPELTTYTAGESVPDCNFDIANMTLVSPPGDAVVSLPVTFTWQKRGIPGDTYGMRIFWPSRPSAQWETGDLGDVDKYTLTFHPGFVYLGEQYAWDGFVYNGSNGHGTSFWGILFVFTSSQAGLHQYH